MATGRGHSLNELFEAYGRVAELDFDDAFAEHMAVEQRGYGKHRVSEQEIREVLSETPRFFENIGERRAPAVMLGPTRAGSNGCCATRTNPPLGSVAPGDGIRG